MKFLVVDDHALIREALRGVFAELRADAFVLEAPNCQQALALIRDNPDLSLILLDLKLPDRDGLEMLAELRENHPAISVVYAPYLANFQTAIDDSELATFSAPLKKDLLQIRFRTKAKGVKLRASQAVRTGSGEQPVAE